MDSFLSIISSIISIAAAIWAFIEARKAGTSATKAEMVRDEMIGHRELVEVSKIHARTEEILRKISKIGPSCSAKTLKGIDSASFAKEVEEYSRYLNEQRLHFSESVANSAHLLCENLKTDIEELSEESKPDLIKMIGTRIYHKINSFMPLAKELTIKKQEKSFIS